MFRPTNFLFQVCGLQFDRKDILMNKLVATSLESKFVTFDMRTHHPTAGYPSVNEKVGDLGWNNFIVILLHFHQLFYTFLGVPVAI